MTALERVHADGLPLLEAIIEQGILTKDAACKLYADVLGIAYVESVPRFPIFKM